jgi:hypothetical protein
VTNRAPTLRRLGLTLRLLKNSDKIYRFTLLTLFAC